jgi:hypothetical protein
VVQPEINSSVSPIIACAQGLFHTLLDMDMRGNTTEKIYKEMYALAVRIEPTPESFQQLSVPSSVVSILRSARLPGASRTPWSVSIGLAHAAQTVMSSAATVEKNRDGCVLSLAFLDFLIALFSGRPGFGPIYFTLVFPLATPTVRCPRSFIFPFLSAFSFSFRFNSCCNRFILWNFLGYILPQFTPLCT